MRGQSYQTFFSLLLGYANLKKFKILFFTAYFFATQIIGGAKKIVVFL